MSFEIPGNWEYSRMKKFEWTPGNFNENRIIADLNLEIPLEDIRSGISQL